MDCDFVWQFGWHYDAGKHFFSDTASLHYKHLVHIVPCFCCYHFFNDQACLKGIFCNDTFFEKSKGKRRKGVESGGRKMSGISKQQIKPIFIL